MAFHRLYTVSVYWRWMDRPEHDRPEVSPLRHQSFMERHHVLFERTFDVTGTPYEWLEAFASEWVESGCPASARAVGRRVPDYVRVATMRNWETRLDDGHVLRRQVDRVVDRGTRQDLARRQGCRDLAQAPGLQRHRRVFAKVRVKLAARQERDREEYEAEVDFLRSALGTVAPSRLDSSPPGPIASAA